MPEEKTNLIKLGFNLEGYILKDKSSDSSMSMGEGLDGVITDWGEWALDEDRWIKDKSLKQVVVQCSYYQNTPAQYTDKNGKTGYLCLGDKTGEIDGKHGKGVGGNGGLAFGGAIAGTLSMDKATNKAKYGSNSKIQTWLNSYESGRTNFVCGCGMSPNTITDYLNYFYPGINVTKNKHVYPLLRAHILNAEIVYNIGNNQGKAFRLKIVDSPGDTKGQKGTFFRLTPYQYDVFDTMLCCLLSQKFHDVVKISTPNDLNEISFPFASIPYDYKNASIPGYGPGAILDYDFNRKSINPVQYIKWTSTGQKNVNSWPLGKVRLFIDEADRGKAQQILPNCPDDLFKTNYTEGASMTMGAIGEFKLTGIMNDDIKMLAQQIRRFAQQHGFTYMGAKAGINKTFAHNNKQDIWKDWAGAWIAPKVQNGYHTDCSHYVTWVLNEVGAFSKVGQLTTSNFANLSGEKFNSRYRAKRLSSPSEIKVGDILVWFNTSVSNHVGIASEDCNPRAHWGMGGNSDFKDRGDHPAKVPANYYYRIEKIS